MKAAECLRAALHGERLVRHDLLLDGRRARAEERPVGGPAVREGRRHRPRVQHLPPRAASSRRRRRSRPQQGQHAKAAELFLRAEDMASAADAYEQRGRRRQGRDLPRRGGAQEGSCRRGSALLPAGPGLPALGRALRVHRDAGRGRRAPTRRARAMRPAGSVYARAGLKERAAGSYERAGEFETAAKLYDGAGDDRKATSSMRAPDRPSRAARPRSRPGDYERAVALLQRVPPNDESFRFATELLAQALIALGRPQLAVERLTKVLAGQADLDRHARALLLAGHRPRGRPPAGRGAGALQEDPGGGPGLPRRGGPHAGPRVRGRAPAADAASSRSAGADRRDPAPCGPTARGHGRASHHGDRTGGRGSGAFRAPRGARTRAARHGLPGRRHGRQEVGRPAPAPPRCSLRPTRPRDCSPTSRPRPASLTRTSRA